MSLEKHAFGHMRRIRMVIAWIARVDASLEQARADMAWAYTQYLTDQAVFHAELAARRERLGLWWGTAPLEPWVWRQFHQKPH